MTSVPFEGVKIGAREIYDMCLGTSTKVDVLLSQYGDLAKDLADHEVRIRLVDGTPARVADLERQVRDLQAALRELQATRWPLQSVAIVVSLLGLALAVLTYMTK